MTNSVPATDKPAAAADMSEARVSAALRLLEKQEEWTKRYTQMNAELESRAAKLHDEVARREQELLKRQEAAHKADLDRAAKFNDEVARREQALLKREEAVHKAELDRDADFSAQRLALRDENAAARQAARDALEREIEQERKARESALTGEMTKRRQDFEAELRQARDDVNRRRDELGEEIRRAQEEMANQREEARRMMDAKWQEREKEVCQREANANARLLEVEAREAACEESWERLEETLDDRANERAISAETRAKAAEAECTKLRQGMTQQRQIYTACRELMAKLGEDPALILEGVAFHENRCTKLEEELASRPSAQMLRDYEALKEDRENLQFRCNNLQETCDHLSRDNQIKGAKANQLDAAETERDILRAEASLLRDANASLSETVRRLSTPQARTSERNDRIKSILFPPYFPAPHPLRGEADKGSLNEVEWLKGIADSCADYGIPFHHRILNAFHTSIKTAEWSPVTVLAGVSGTGKSELPRLYSHFGGMKFLSLPVQPNWDSQESMLGFFNSIDDRFDAQPLLRLLAQSQTSEKEAAEIWKEGAYASLEDAMVMVLLDEMNLAHIEMYFAEFLSKLENRRGRSWPNLPQIEIKLGTDLGHYSLPLGRNVLWTGTMNQDETTKSLSDKVLDRSFVLYFPSPTRFERRAELKPFGKAEETPLLHAATWERWTRRNVKFMTEQIAPFKEMAENINAAMGKVGRALGHRVWQSMEYYMANYPEVIAAQEEENDDALKQAMRVAFEDQLVFKIMPKLRGIDTRGDSLSACLKPIRTMIAQENYQIVGDFDHACKAGYGQFIWSSAEYLKVENEPESRQPSPDPEQSALAE